MGQSNIVEAEAESENGRVTRRGPKLEGVGLPYALENWPESGDNWTWKTGVRISPCSGFYRDRYLKPPQRFRRAIKPIRSIKEFKKLVVSNFTNVDYEGLLRSFTWKIPSHHQLTGADAAVVVPYVCKAGNGSCIIQEADSSPLMPCNGCCANPTFCRFCTCNTCFRTVHFEQERYIKCTNVVDGAICGHVVHSACCLGSYFGADYYCRRCNLVPYPERAQKIYDSMASPAGAHHKD